MPYSCVQQAVREALESAEWGSALLSIAIGAADTPEAVDDSAPERLRLRALRLWSSHSLAVRPLILAPTLPLALRL